MLIAAAAARALPDALRRRPRRGDLRGSLVAHHRRPSRSATWRAAPRRHAERERLPARTTSSSGCATSATRAFAAGERREAVARRVAAIPPTRPRCATGRRGYLADGARAAPPTRATLIGIAAPHVSPEGGWRSYAAAYARADPGPRDRTFVILGTSHYGEPERFGLTRKPFLTPLGDTHRGHGAASTRWPRTAGPRCVVEDYCHAVEHSIEFQVVFLQHLFGAGVRIVPDPRAGPSRGAARGAGRREDDAGVPALPGRARRACSARGRRALLGPRHRHGAHRPPLRRRGRPRCATRA